MVPKICNFSKYTVLINGVSQIMAQISWILRSFTENWILRLQKADFDDLYTIGSEFASPTRSHIPFPGVCAKNAVSENLYWQFFANIRRFISLFFAKLRQHIPKRMSDSSYFSQVYFQFVDGVFETKFELKKTNGVSRKIMQTIRRLCLY